MAEVHLRRVTRENFDECVGLQVEAEQAGFVATNTQSLAQAFVDSNLFPFAIYDAVACGHGEPEVPMIGFAMTEMVAGVGFIMRLMIDKKYQRQGYGRAATLELIRRLKLNPEVELIATSYRKENTAAAKLYQALGFRAWNISWAISHPTEIYVKLEDS